MHGDTKLCDGTVIYLLDFVWFVEVLSHLSPPPASILLEQNDALIASNLQRQIDLEERAVEEGSRRSGRKREGQDCRVL